MHVVPHRSIKQIHFRIEKWTNDCHNMYKKLRILSIYALFAMQYTGNVCKMLYLAALMYFKLVLMLSLWEREHFTYALRKGALSSCKKYRSMSACAIHAGWHGSILFLFWSLVCLSKDVRPQDSAVRQRMIDWLNGVLHHFQQYISHITATSHIIHVFPGFHQY